VDSVSDPKILQDKNLVIVTVVPDSPADQAKLISGDKILSLSAGGEKVSDLNPVTLREFIVSHEEKIILEYKRQEEIVSTEIVPVASTADGKPSIGISMAEIGTLKLPFGKALIEGAKFTWTVTEGTVVGLYGIVHSAVTGAGGVKDAITGPVGMVRIVGDASEFGFAYLLSFAALISVNLAVINLVPFPALDGGRLLFVLIEKIKGSRINPNFANIANMIGFWLLILLMVFVTYNDIAKLI
ncbi:MAG: site-2 protease family protein, partial [Candidatus Paceibacterota bacterium]